MEFCIFFLFTLVMTLSSCLKIQNLEGFFNSKNIFKDFFQQKCFKTAHFYQLSQNVAPLKKGCDHKLWNFCKEFNLNNKFRSKNMQQKFKNQLNFQL